MKGKSPWIELGNKGHFNAGPSFPAICIDYDAQLGAYAWFEKNANDVGETFPHMVAKKKANPWGFHNMHGKVLEWCGDGYAAALPGGSDPLCRSVCRSSPTGLGPSNPERQLDQLRRDEPVGVPGLRKLDDPQRRPGLPPCAEPRQVTAGQATGTLHERTRYQEAGVPEYWIVDPMNHTVEQLVLRDGVYQLLPASDVFQLTILNGITVRLAEVW